MLKPKPLASSDSAELRKAGLKATLPRLKILAVLERNCDLHMSAEDVYRALMESGDDVGLATVYRVLTQFEAAGLIIRHNFTTGTLSLNSTLATITITSFASTVALLLSSSMPPSKNAKAKWRKSTVSRSTTTQ